MLRNKLALEDWYRHGIFFGARLQFRERAAWREHPLLPEAARYPAFPDATHWGGELDSYWRIAGRPGTLDVPDTNWTQLAAAITADLAIRVPSSLVPAGPVFLSGPEPESWAKFPQFPKSSVAAPAHHLLATLYREQVQLSNGMNPKNEDNHYQNLDAVRAAALQRGSVRSTLTRASANAWRSTARSPM